MITLPPAENEASRVEMVRSFGLLDRPRSMQHDEISALAGELARTRWALVTLVEDERNWFSGAANFGGAEACRWSSFCTHVISEPDELLWIADAREDFRFARNPYVTGEPHLRFYAGAPVVVNGHAVGTVCVFDPEPRPFDPAIAASLTRLAKVVAEDLAARHRAESLAVSLEASADALIDCDHDGLITSWSEGAARLFGYPAEEALGSDIDLIIPPDMRAGHHFGFNRWRQSGGGRIGRKIDLTACRSDGSLIDIALWMSVSHVRGVPHIHANIRDISERKANEAALKLAKSQADAASEAKTAFLTNMSHELRTPLNGVIGVVDLLASTEQTDHQRELTSIIRSSSDQLGRLIGDILDLGRIESGQVILAQSPMVLSDVVDSVLNVSGLAAQEKGLNLRFEPGGDLALPVIGDALRLKQVLSNLVSNAVKFTADGSVTLRVDRTGDEYRFEVRDTGIGFDDAQRDVIFGRFQQADDSITRRFGGTGLGLAISRQLVEAMGGELECAGTPERGASFWFTVPLIQSETPSSEDVAADETPLSIGRVLVVDDNATNRRVAELILQTAGIEVVSVEDGQQAVESVVNGTFDAILMDMMMPVMDGMAATQAIRQLEGRDRRRRTPIIMLTANNLPEHAVASLDAGADLHLPKPISASALFHALGGVQNLRDVQESDTPRHARGVA